MSLFDVLLKVASSAAKTTVNQRNDAARRYEKEHPNMDQRTREKLNEFDRKTRKLADFSGVQERTYNSCEKSSSQSRTAQLYMGKTVAQWDSEWISIGMLKSADLSPYNHCVGLYRHVVNGTTKYVGRAIELNNGGFRKRLSDYRRDSDSARKHSSGRIIHEHLDEIETYIMVVGDTTEAIDATRQLEGIFVRKYNPEWNRQFNI